MFQPDKHKPPAYDLMQDDDNYNWSIEDMPWKNGMSPRNGSSVVMFNGSTSQQAPVPSTSGFNLTSHPRMKRKSQEVNYFPSKQQITEEKMSLHLNGIHLSDSFQAHNININDSTFEEEMDMAYNVNLSPQELERRLRNAQRITLCDDVKKSLKKNNEIIPKVLLDRIEKPCQALVLWQPPQTIGTLLTDFNHNQSTSDKSMDDAEVKNDNADDEKMCE